MGGIPEQNGTENPKAHGRLGESGGPRRARSGHFMWRARGSPGRRRKTGSPLFPSRPAGTCADPGQGDGHGADGGTRTPDPRITNALLYQLSYIGSGLVRDGRVPRTAVLAAATPRNAARNIVAERPICKREGWAPDASAESRKRTVGARLLMRDAFRARGRRPVGLRPPRSFRTGTGPDERRAGRRARIVSRTGRCS